MKHVPHDPKSSEPRLAIERGQRVGASLLVVAALVTGGAGCNIVQGYQDAGDSLFPEQSTHLAAPGLRLVSGHYREVGVVGGTELYLLARGADDDTGRLYAMRYASPKPCEIGGALRFSVTREPSRNVPLLAYYSEDARRGTLRFADANCKKYPLSFDDARLPLAETEKSLVVWAGSELWLATPETESKELLVDDIAEVMRGVLGERNAVRAGGRVHVFDQAWKPLGTFGEEVSDVQKVQQSLFFTDATGAHRLVVSDDDSAVEEELLVPDGCSLGSQDGVWVTLRAPCEGGELVAIHEPSGQSYTLPFDADPRQLQLVAARNSPGQDPLVDPFWFFYLRSGDDEGTANALFVRTPAGDELALGAHSTLRHLRLLESASDTYGYALVDVEGETGRYIWWNPDGETRVLAENAMWRPDRLIVDSDGTVGSLAVASGDRLRVVAEGVPWQAFEYQDQTKQWTVLFHDMQEGMGQLSVFNEGLDRLESVPSDQPFAVPQLTAVASNVVVLGTSSLYEVLSGVSYLSQFDLTTRTGRLEYRNLELRFTARVNDGVSDYLVANDELLYAIPYGDDAGIWLVSAK